MFECLHQNILQSRNATCKQHDMKNWKWQVKRSKDVDTVDILIKVSQRCRTNRWLIVMSISISEDCFTWQNRKSSKSEETVKRGLPPPPWTQKNVWQGANIKHKCFWAEDEDGKKKTPSNPPMDCCTPARAWSSSPFSVETVRLITAEPH